MEYHVTLDGTESLFTFGGETWEDDWQHADYGIDFNKVSVSGLTPNQMTTLACIMVDHLILNGHDFEIRKTCEQDQHTRLVHVSSNI
jgi:hypothetical protein